MSSAIQVFLSIKKHVFLFKRKKQTLRLQRGQETPVLGALNLRNYINQDQTVHARKLGSKSRIQCITSIVLAYQFIFGKLSVLPQLQYATIWVHAIISLLDSEH